MDVAIGLPNAVAGTTGKQIVDWAHEAEQAGFSSLGTIDRLVYPSHEPLVALAAAAGVTERIRLTTSVLLAPLRRTPLLAKQAATVNEISGGRLVLGMGVGGREDDFELAGVDMHQRGRIFDEQLEQMTRLWADGEIAPGAAPTVILGGSVDASFRRAAKYGAGWIMGGGPPDQFKEAVPKLREAWKAEGRDGEPRKMALAYYSLGPNAAQAAQRSIGHYYAWLGEYAQMIVDSAAKDADTVKQYVAAFEEAECDELILFPADGDPEQVALLREALG